MYGTKIGQTQMTAVWKEAREDGNVGERKKMGLQPVFCIFIADGIPFTALAAPQAGLNKTKLTMIKGTAEELVLSGDISGKIYMEELKKVSCNGQCDGPSESKEKRNGNGHGTCRW